MKLGIFRFGSLRHFLRGEEGLVTIEWVALAAGLVVAAVAIGVMVMDTTAGEASTIVGDISTNADTAIGAATNLAPYAP